MPRQAQGETPAELDALAQRLAEHRRNRPGRGRLPELLWRQAARLAARYGVNRVHQVLRLDYYPLKRGMESLAAGKPVSTGRPAFVELGLGPPLLSAGTLVEVEERGGRKLTVRLAAERRRV